MKTIIHVDQQVIASNRKNKTNLPPLTVKTYKSNERAHTVEIKDKDGDVIARVVHSPHKPLSCGARVWIECYTEINTSLFTKVREQNNE